MKRGGYFSWDSSLMEIISAEEKVSKSTEKPYIVIKARMSCRVEPRYSSYKTWSKKVYTMLCFKESLFGLFEAGNHHTFEGELSFDWGNTWLKITRLYDDKGNRLLRPFENIDINDTDEKVADNIEKSVAFYFPGELDKIRRENEDIVCEHNCEECLDYDTSDCPLY